MMVSHYSVSQLLQPYFSGLVALHNPISSSRYKMAPRNYGAIFFMAPGYDGSLEIEIGEFEYRLTSGKVYLAGLGCLPSVISFKREAKLFVMLLKPHMIGFFSEPASDLTNRIFCWSDTSASAALTNTKIWNNLDCNISILETFFRNLFDSFVPSPGILNAMESIRQSDGYINIPDLARQIFTSDRNLLRFFLKYVGISPKLYCSMVRFNSLLKDYINDVEESLDPLLVKYNYYDHSHLVKDFIRFTAMKPTLFKAHDHKLNMEIFQ